MPAPIARLSTAPASSISEDLSKSFLVPLGSRSYSKQYAQLYDYRLAYLKKRILPRAKSRWIDNFDAFSQSQSQPSSQLDTSEAGPSNGNARVKMEEPPKFVDRILDVRQGDICYIVGNLYCAMPLKPDVLEDLTREVSSTLRCGSFVIASGIDTPHASIVSLFNRTAMVGAATSSLQIRRLC